MWHTRRMLLTKMRVDFYSTVLLKYIYSTIPCVKGRECTVKKANGNQRRDRNFPFPLLENPIRGSEQK